LIGDGKTGPKSLFSSAHSKQVNFLADQHFEPICQPNSTQAQLGMFCQLDLHYQFPKPKPCGFAADKVTAEISTKVD